MSKSPKEEKINLEKSFAELEKITEEMQSGNLNLEESLKKFERGLELAEKLKTRLQEIENRMETIKLKFKKTLGQEESGKEETAL
ncbi:MAG: exodeoxyribonuclease VII small subunit [Patescibacteria group bacterium]